VAGDFRSLGDAGTGQRLDHLPDPVRAPFDRRPFGSRSFPVRVAVAQYAVGTDLVKNIEGAVSAARRAADEGAELLVLPELADVGYPVGIAAEDMVEYFSRTSVDDNPLLDALGAVCQESGMHICVGYAERDPQLPGVLRNAAALLKPETAPTIFRTCRRAARSTFRSTVPGLGRPRLVRRADPTAGAGLDHASVARTSRLDGLHQTRVATG